MQLPSSTSGARPRRRPGGCSEIGFKLADLPPSLNVHPRLKRVLQGRRKAIEAAEGIDWATAEQLALATLLVEGYPVRLSGEDVGRGTFSQRHAAIHDQTTEERYVPLAHLAERQESIRDHRQHAVRGGRAGLRVRLQPGRSQLPGLWEAQFGDFANGAQVYFDQFISSGESKWLRMCGLVCLLPHGYEGQGPEHSSARLERFLQLYAENNLQVVYPSTPASYFHVAAPAAAPRLPQAADRA